MSRVCPKCGKEYDDYPSLSRKDNKTEICPKCGIAEALEEFFTAKVRMARCKDCAYLVCGDNGEWICDDCGKECLSIPDDECSAEQEW